jgi:hypothetical protein
MPMNGSGDVTRRASTAVRITMRYHAKRERAYLVRFVAWRT